MLADGTREFRYNYKNQLRRVWRKSDGESDGAISKYREDAFGRRVYAETSWELSRRVYLDTRFELDIDMSADGDSQSMVYADGGITSTHSAPPGQLDQKAAWDSRIDRPATTTNESHYFDFLVEVPEAPDGVEYLGFVAYDRFELRIFGDGYELWDVGGTPTLIDSVSATTVGRRNIGIRAGVDAGVWIDGYQRLGGPTTILPRPQVRFGTHSLGETNQPGLILLENLCYVRSWLRHVSEEESIPTGPRVTTTFFDGPRPVTVREPVDAETSMVVVNFTEDGTRADHTAHNDSIDTLTLPNGRRTTGQVIRPHADRTSYEGTRVELDEEAPGVSIFIHVDGIGATTAQNRKTAPALPDPTPLLTVCFNGASTTFDYLSTYGVSDIAIYLGVGGSPEGDAPRAVTAMNNAPGSGVDVDLSLLGAFNVDTGTCACRDSDASRHTFSIGTKDAATGGEIDYVGGNMIDVTKGVIYSGGYTGPAIAELLADAEPDQRGGTVPSSDNFWNRPREPGAGLHSGFEKKVLRELGNSAVEGGKHVLWKGALALAGPVGWGYSVYEDTQKGAEIVGKAKEGAAIVLDSPSNACRDVGQWLEDEDNQASVVAAGIEIWIGGYVGSRFSQSRFRKAGEYGPDAGRVQAPRTPLDELADRAASRADDAARAPKADAPAAEGPSNRQRNWEDAVREAKERIAKQKADNPEWDGMKAQAQEPDGSRPPNLAPHGSRRRGAFAAAKRASGVPVCTQPSRVVPNLDKRGVRQQGRIYEFRLPSGKVVRIRDDAGGHYYGPGNRQNRNGHFNDEAGGHYDYE